MKLPHRLVEIAPGVSAHASGALWLPSERTVLIADVHLGYAWAMRRRGQLGPLLTGGVEERLLQLGTELQPQAYVFLGDLVHAPRPCPEERAQIESTLRSLTGNATVVLVLGNHDRGFLKDFPNLDLHVTDSWQTTDLVAIHGDRDFAADRLLVLGHHHPALSIRDAAGAKLKFPVFLVGQHACVLPAFSPFAAGVDMRRGLPAPLRSLFAGETITAIAATGQRVVLLGPVLQ